MNTFDLQIQSTASDGKHTPGEIVGMAKNEGLQIIALTDHDTVDGIPEALSAGGELGVRVIPGIEMSVEERDSHILGLGIDGQNPELLAQAGKFKEDRIKRAKEMVQKFKEAGFVAEWEDVAKAAGGVVTSLHVVLEILGCPENKEKLGSVRTKQDFYQKFLYPGSQFEAARVHPSAKYAIELIHKAGGVAVWSHPAIHFHNDYEGLEEFLRELIEWGIDGVEVFSRSHTEDDVEFLYGIAARLAILRTAGSDFHAAGSPKEPDMLGLRPAAKVGDYQTFGFPTGEIIPRLDEAMQRQKDRIG